MADGALEFRIVLATLSPTMAFCQVATWANLQEHAISNLECNTLITARCAVDACLESIAANANIWNAYI